MPATYNGRDKMKNYSTELWSISLPDDWMGEQDQDCEVLYHPEGPGTLQISLVQHTEPVTDDDLEAMAAEHIEAGAETEDVVFGPFVGFGFSYAVEDEYLCEWYLRSDFLMLFVTYSCPLEQEGEEDDIIDFMLETLRRL